MRKINVLKRLDKPLLFFMIVYSVLGCIMILSASSVSAVMKFDVSPYYFFIRQTAFVLFSFLFGFLVILKYPTRKYKRIIPLLSIGLLGLLVFLLIYGGLVNGAKSWIDLKFFSLQPSEFAKIIIVLFMGVYYGEIADRNSSKYGFIVPILFAFLVCVLVFAQPDLGTCLIIAGITFLTYLSIPFNTNKTAKMIKILGGAVAIIGLIFIVTGSSMLNEMQLGRLNYKNPCTRYTEDSGYQVCNGFIALNNGGLFGKGLGNSSQKYLYLPEAHTDFIFPIIVEELGLIVGIFIILGYVFIIFRIIKIAKESFELRNSIICYGVAMYILLHIIVNLGGILALIPLTGVPLPFLSYGGSSSLTLLASLFIVLRISIENGLSKQKLEIERL